MKNTRVNTNVLLRLLFLILKFFLSNYLFFVIKDGRNNWYIHKYSTRRDELDLVVNQSLLQVCFGKEH